MSTSVAFFDHRLRNLSKGRRYAKPARLTLTFSFKPRYSIWCITCRHHVITSTESFSSSQVLYASLICTIIITIGINHLAKKLLIEAHSENFLIRILWDSSYPFILPAKTFLFLCLLLFLCLFLTRLFSQSRGLFVSLGLMVLT